MMKGMVFTQFLDMVEAEFSPEAADKIIVQAGLPSGGSYTSVGTYDHSEIVALVAQLSQETGLHVPAPVEAFGGSVTIERRNDLEDGGTRFDLIRED